MNFLHKIFGTTPNDGDIQPKEGLSFSIAGFGQNMICTIVGSYLTVFMTDAIGYPALWVAFLMLFARIYDAFNDPIMGSIVDRTRTPWGKCRPYLKWMPIPIAIMTILCFLPWYPATPGGFAALCVVYVLWGMVYTVADVPYWAMVTCMTDNTYKRSNLLSIARLICTLGAGIVTIILPQITSAQMTATQESYGIAGADPNTISQAVKDAFSAEIAGTYRWTYFIAAIVICVIAVPLFFIGFKGTVERSVNVENKPSLGHNLKLLGKNKPLLLIVLSGVLGAAKIGFTYTGGLYFCKYVLADVNILGMQGEGLYTLFVMTVVPGGLLATFIVPYLTKKIGKKHAFIWPHIVGGVAMLVAFFVGLANKDKGYADPVTVWIMIVSFVIAGIPTGLGNILSYALIGDTVEYLEWKTGERAEGICYAMQTFMSKIGMAVGAFLGVLAYEMADVTANDAAALSAEGKDIMWILLILVGAISFIASAIPLFFYTFTEKKQEQAVAEIRARREAAGLPTDDLDQAEEEIAPENKDEE